MPNEKRSSAVKKKIRARNRLLGFLAVVGFVVVCLFTPLFNISSVSVTGNKILSDEAVIKASGIAKGDNLFLVNTKKCEKSINALGYVKDVKIKRKFFSRIEIEVVESGEAAYIAFSGNYVGVSAEGKVVSITKSSKIKPKKAVISGYALNSAKKGEMLDGKKEEKTEAVLLMLRTLSDNSLLSGVKKIDISDLKAISFVLNSDTKVTMGDTLEADYKLKCLSAVLGELGEVRGGKIDVSNPSNVIYEGGN